jgi:CDGSH-type Zn-finger protein/uncharacterized Fe-S cluster protein YjdI
MAQEEPKIRIETREELIYMLAEAAAIEHSLMCCYLYAAWSLKRSEEDGLTPAQAEATKQWSHAITSVAIEEMSHLTLANNLLTSIGAGPHLSHPDFPILPGYYPSGVVVELAGFSQAVLDHFIFLERPEGKELRDSYEFLPVADYHRSLPKGRLMPSAQDYGTVGHLYRGIRHGFEVLAHHIGEQALFCGEPASQIGAPEASLPGLLVVTDLASAEEAIETIIEQGEGAPGHSENSHYNRFMTVRQEYNDFLAVDPAFAPAFSVAHNPVPRPAPDAHNRVHVNSHEAAGALDLANSIYGHMLRCLVQAYGRGSDTEGKRFFVDAAIDLMEVLPRVGQHLASLPANHRHPGIHAGVTFNTLRDMARIPPGAGEKRMMAERVAELAKHARHLFPPGHKLAAAGDTLETILARFGVPDLKTVGKSHPLPPPPEADDLPSGSNTCEVISGRDLNIVYDGVRCIHARFCVLGAPAVFKANTPGNWIFPDAADAEALVHIAHECPSGAIAYHRKDGRPQEAAPPVNLVYLRENGPYAFRGPLAIDGATIGFRATLCRCGASDKKPFCDGSHNRIGFKATGEPDTRQSQPLASRDGPVAIAPQQDGPLQVSGNLEVVSGTGRTIDRVTRTRLCRCGGSRTKPFCDNTHLRIGFRSG